MNDLTPKTDKKDYSGLVQLYIDNPNLLKHDKMEIKESFKTDKVEISLSLYGHRKGNHKLRDNLEKIVKSGAFGVSFRLK